MPEKLETLQKYWKHDSFRPLQSEIIEEVLNGRDVLALMPTGGGKSICFQIPALMKDGICLVISPLIALMKDQVENLQKRNIKAVALTGGIRLDEAIEILDNCLYGGYKFLYLSPERLQSEWIWERIRNTQINLIAIDEAHCVSQWGHDFRPAYLEISKLKKEFPETPFLALTATATPRVREDVILHLKLQNPRLFQQSFARKNIAYMVFDVEDKFYRMEQILKKNPQPSIIYVRNRKSCIDISTQLQNVGIRATYYHGGLMATEKTKNMNSWMKEESQVIVATNAFGMGIDKPNVRTVIHVQIPENLENYYQEAGRAGRDENDAYAIILNGPSDLKSAYNQFVATILDTTFVKQVYIKLCNYFQIAYEDWSDEEYAFNLSFFCSKYDFHILKTYKVIEFLDQQGVITISKEFSEKTKIQFIISSTELIDYISLNADDAEIILCILRTYTGIYDTRTIVSIKLIAKKTNIIESEIHSFLLKLKEKGIIEYSFKSNDITIVFNEIREDERTINKISKYLENQNRLKEEQLKAVENYVSNKETCKSRIILAYFGEETKENCGICSYCISKLKSVIDVDKISIEIMELLNGKNLTSREIENKINYTSDEVIRTLQNLLENHQIEIKSNNKYSVKK